MRAILMAVAILLAGASAASAQLTLCNRTGQPVEVATVNEEANDDASGLIYYIDGWTRIAPGVCTEVAESWAVYYAYYVRQPATGRIWQGDEDAVLLCVKLRRDFRINYDSLEDDLSNADDFSCPDGATKRPFIVLDNDGFDEYTIDLK